MVSRTTLTSYALAVGLLSTSSLYAATTVGRNGNFYLNRINNELALLMEAQNERTIESIDEKKLHYNNVVQYYNEAIEYYQKAFDNLRDQIKVINSQNFSDDSTRQKKPGLFATRKQKDEYKEYIQQVENLANLEATMSKYGNMLQKMRENLRALQAQQALLRVQDWNKFMIYGDRD